VRVFERLAVAHRDELQRIGPKLSEFLEYFSRPPGHGSTTPPSR
jgi:hypothetical protein